MEENYLKKIGVILFKSIIIIIESFFLMVSIYFFGLCWISPESFTLGCECVNSWAWENSNNFLIWKFINIILSSFLIVIILKVKAFYFLLLLLLLTITHIYLLTIWG
jgi:hypothetical protein